MIRAHLFVSGLVQGVNFRWFVRMEARLLGLVGFVRNTDDGRVEIICEGAEEKVRELIEKVKQGTDMAQINQVEVSNEPPQGDLRSFDIFYD